MVVNSSYVYDYMRGIDSRIASMTNADLLLKINYALTHLATQTQCFFTEETIDLVPYINAGITKFEYTPSGNLIDYFKTNIISKVDNSLLMSSKIIIEKQIDKSLMVTIGDGSYNTVLDSLTNNYLDSGDSTQVLIDVGYFFIPELNDTNSITIEPEVWNMFVHSLNMILWEILKDYQKVTYHQNALTKAISTKMLSFPPTMNVDLKGGYL